MRKFTPDELQEILRKHSNWLAGDDDGERADLSGADLHEADLSDANLCMAHLNCANLRGAYLCGACLRDVNLHGADLHNAILCDVNLLGANLRSANLCDADLSSANLSGADLRDADLSCADLSNADLCRANLRGANLCRVDLRDAKNIDSAIWNIYSAFYPLQCPESGSFIGYKTASNLIVKLEICEDALRSSATSRKCRCSKAKVLGFEEFDGTPINNRTLVPSNYDSAFIYEIGKIVEVPDFDTNRWNECAPGIHFFITREEAVKYAN